METIVKVTKYFVFVMFYTVLVMIQSNTLQASDWIYGTDMPTQRAFIGACSHEGRLWVAGGYEGTTGLDTLEVYNLSSGMWEEMSSMPTARYGHVLLSVGSFIYAIGGHTGSNALNSVVAYDPSTDSWSSKTAMNSARHAPAGAVWNGKIYIFGGDSGGTVLNSVEIYDPSTDTWDYLTDMPTPRLLCAAALSGDKIYVAGGFQSNAGSSLNTLEIFDPVTQTWSSGPGMDNKRLGLAAVAACGKIYAMGGDTYYETFSTVEVFDPATGNWTEGTSMDTKRREFGAAVIDGSIYAVGGFNANRTPPLYHTPPLYWNSMETLPTGCPQDEVTDTITDFASLGAEVTALQFYESGADGIPYEERLFSSLFEKSTSRYIHYQISVLLPEMHLDAELTITAKVYGSDGSLYAEFSMDLSIPSEYQNIWWTDGWGSSNPGSWPADTYTLKLFDKNDEFASGNFTVFGDQTVEMNELPDTVVLIDASNDPSNAPVSMGSVLTGGNEMELSFDFPAYNAPADIWVLITLPDGRFYVVDESYRLLSYDDSGFSPLATGAAGTPILGEAVAPFEIGTDDTLFDPWPGDGNWSVYWLVAPESNGNIMEALFSGKYELGFYTFQVNKTEGEDQDTLSIVDYYPQSGPQGTDVSLQLNRSIAELPEELNVFYNGAMLDNGTILISGNSLQFTVPSDAESGDIHLVSGDIQSGKVPFSLLTQVQTPLISKILAPSTENQVLNYNDEIIVTIPSGILDAPRTLSIAAIENGPPNSVVPYAASSTIDVSIEGLEQLNDYIEISVKYDPALLNPDYSPEEQLIPMRWDEDANYWFPLPYKVDTQQEMLRFYTDHLSVMTWVVIGAVGVASIPVTWVGEKLLNDVYVTPEGNFRLLYSKSAINADVALENGAWRKSIFTDPFSRRSEYDDSHPISIQDIGSLLENALNSYVDVHGFKDPVNKPGWFGGSSQNPITVKIDSFWVSHPWGAPNYEKVWQNIHFPVSSLKDYTKYESYATIGHELFHRIQAEYYGKTGLLMPSNLWWVEAAADYAGNRVAWSGVELSNMHEKTGWDFFSYPINTTGEIANANGWSLDQSYEYAASAFIQYLVEKKNLDFKDLMESVASRYLRYTPLENLSAVSGITLPVDYRDFAAWGIFSSDSFLKKYDIPEIAEETETISLSINKTHSANVIFTSRNNDSFLSIYKLDKGFVRTAGIPQPDGMIGNEEGFFIDVEAEEALYLLAVNPGVEDDSLNVSVKVDEDGKIVSSTQYTFEVKGGYSAKLWVISFDEDEENGSGSYNNSWNNVVYNGITFDFSIQVSGTGSYLREYEIDQNGEGRFYITLAIPRPAEGEKHTYTFTGNTTNVNIPGQDVVIRSLDWDTGYNRYQGNPAMVTVTKSRIYVGTSDSELVKDLLFVIDFDKNYQTEQLGSIGRLRGAVQLSLRRE